jgi:UDP-GlcNAc:undecaprenyl-phosphate GlcNAc-1-phosphate transferase
MGDSMVSAQAAQLLPPLVAAVLTWLLAPLAARLAVLVGAVDVPGVRKVHTTPIPRLGGLAVIGSVAIVLSATSLAFGSYLPVEISKGLGFGLLPILIVSVADDIRPVPALVKLLAHVTGAVIAILCGVTLNPVVHLFEVAIDIGVLAGPLSIVWLVGVTNAFNIIDGLDGLSSGLALISAISMAAVFGVLGQPTMAAATLVLAGALAGFLPYNLHPARLFLGDSGATAIGFCLAAFALKGGATLTSGFAAIVPLFIMGLPIADTLIAMARRTMARGDGVFTADGNHIHHRLLALGVGHRQAVLILYAAGFICAGVAFMSVFLKARQAALLIASLLVAGVVGLQRLGYEEFAFIRRGTVLRVYEAPVLRRSMFVVFFDLALAAVAAYVTAMLKLDGWTLATVQSMVIDLVATFAPLTAIVFWYSGVYRGNWRVAGVVDLARLVGAALVVTGLGMVTHGFIAATSTPTSVFFIYALVSIVLFTSSRGSYVVLLNSSRRASNQGRPVLIYGSGERSVAAIRELFDNPGSGLRPVGFVDDDPRTHGKTLSGLPVLGGTDRLDQILAEVCATGIVVPGTEMSGSVLERMAEACYRTGTSLFRLQVQLEELDDRHEEQATTPARVAELGTEIDTAIGLERGLLSLVPAVESGFAPDQPEAEPCRRCRSNNVYRSHARGFYERMRKARSPKRPYRCRDCGWRGWLQPIEASIALDVPDTPDLTALDTQFDTRVLDATVDVRRLV